MFALLYDPVTEIRKVKTQGYATLFLYLLAVSLFIIAGCFFAGLRYWADKMANPLLPLAVIGVFLNIIIVTLLIAFFFSVSMHVLDGKGGYYEGLASLVLAMVAPAVALFFGGASLFLPKGIFLAVAFLAYGCVVGCATLFRAGKELFELDYAGVLIGIIIILLPLSLGVTAVTLL